MTGESVKRTITQISRRLYSCRLRDGQVKIKERKREEEEEKPVLREAKDEEGKEKLIAEGEGEIYR